MVFSFLFLCLIERKINQIVPIVMAISAILKMPVRTDPMPIFIKSMTLPSLKMRSIRLPMPPARMRERAAVVEFLILFVFIRYVNRTSRKPATKQVKSR